MLYSSYLKRICRREDHGRAEEKARGGGEGDLGSDEALFRTVQRHIHAVLRAERRFPDSLGTIYVVTVSDLFLKTSLYILKTSLSQHSYKHLKYYFRFFTGRRTIKLVKINQNSNGKDVLNRIT